MKYNKKDIFQMAHDGKKIQIYVCEASNAKRNYYSTFEEAEKNMNRNKLNSRVYLGETFVSEIGGKYPSLLYGVKQIGDDLTRNY